MVIIDMFLLYAFLFLSYSEESIDHYTVYMIIDRGVLEGDGEIMSFFIY